jgi:hypothetical protein
LIALVTCKVRVCCSDKLDHMSQLPIDYGIMIEHWLVYKTNIFCVSIYFEIMENKTYLRAVITSRLIIKKLLEYLIFK